MTTVTGIRFKPAGKVYYFKPNGFTLDKGDFVVVETSRGLEFGEVVIATKDVEYNDEENPLKDVIRMATDEDAREHCDNIAKAKEAFKICAEKIKKHELDMKLIDVEYTLDRSKVLFYFVSDNRIDFRELVKDLAATFKTRIELRQVGIRDHARLLGGIGPCGREYCCSSCMTEFQPVSIKMAKEQGLSLNPTKISGNCGKLMCCLKYEQEAYEAALKVVPPVGAYVKSQEGRGVVIANNLLKETVTIKFEDENLEQQIIKACDVTFLPREEIEEMKNNAAKAEAEREEKRRQAQERAEQRAQQIAAQAEAAKAHQENAASAEAVAPSPTDMHDEDEVDDVFPTTSFFDGDGLDDEFTELTEEELAALQDEDTAKNERRKNGNRGQRPDRNRNRDHRGGHGQNSNYQGNRGGNGQGGKENRGSQNHGRHERKNFKNNTQS